MVLILLAIISVVLVLTPAVLIQPFRPQSTRALEISYALKRWSPTVTAIFLAAVVLCSILLWSNARRWWRKGLLVLLVLLAIAPTWFARQNHFEWMFNPLKNSAYVKPAEASFIDDKDMVLAVKINNEAVAYPVRLMAYHHLVQDTVGGVAVVATY